MTRGAIPSASRARRPSPAPPAGSGGPGVTAPALERAARRVADHLVRLESRLDSGGDSAWRDYLDTVRTLAALASMLSSAQPRLLTTQEMAARLGISPKTLRKRKRMGLARPTLAHGRLVRWRADEGLR